MNQHSLAGDFLLGIVNHVTTTHRAVDLENETVRNDSAVMAVPEDVVYPSVTLPVVSDGQLLSLPEFNPGLVNIDAAKSRKQLATEPDVLLERSRIGRLLRQVTHLDA